MAPRNRPRPVITWQMRLRRFIYTLETPLKLRASLTRLGHRHKYPILALLRLFLPFPTWHFSIPDPVPLREILDNVKLLESRNPAADLRNMRSIPLWRARDTPLRSIYRIYEAMAARESYAIGPEVEYFWYQSRQSWELHRIPDPHDRDPVRYAILACITEELVSAFNWRLSLGMRRDKRKHIHRKTFDDVLPLFIGETAPSWTADVAAIDVRSIIDLPDDALDTSGRLVLETGGKSPTFTSRNIITGTRDFYTI